MSAKANSKVNEPEIIDVPPPAVEPAAKEPLITRVRVATGHAVVRSFASLRSIQVTTVQRMLGWLTVLDATTARSLAAGEHYLLARLHPEPGVPTKSPGS